MNKKQYFLLTLLLSCCTHQTMQAIRMPIKTLLAFATGVGFFGFEVSKTKEQAAQLPDAVKTRLQRTYPLTDATLQTTSDFLTKSAYGLALAAMHVEAKRAVLLDKIEALGRKLTDSVKHTSSSTETETITSASTHSQEPVQPNAQTVLEAAGSSVTPAVETSTTLPDTTNKPTNSEALQVLAPAIPAAVAPVVNE